MLYIYTSYVYISMRQRCNVSRKNFVENYRFFSILLKLGFCQSWKELFLFLYSTLWNIHEKNSCATISHFLNGISWRFKDLENHFSCSIMQNSRHSAWSLLILDSLNTPVTKKIRQNFLERTTCAESECNTASKKDADFIFSRH